MEKSQDRLMLEAREEDSCFAIYKEDILKLFEVCLNKEEFISY